MLSIIQKEIGFIKIINRFKNSNVQIKILLSSKTELVKFDQDINKSFYLKEKII